MLRRIHPADREGRKLSSQSYLFRISKCSLYIYSIRQDATFHQVHERSGPAQWWPDGAVALLDGSDYCEYRGVKLLCGHLNTNTRAIKPDRLSSIASMPKNDALIKALMPTKASWRRSSFSFRGEDSVFPFPVDHADASAKVQIILCYNRATC